jgi:hypothetical protein
MSFLSFCRAGVSWSQPNLGQDRARSLMLSSRSSELGPKILTEISILVLIIPDRRKSNSMSSQKVGHNDFRR